MCGRAKLEGDISEIKIAFRVPPDYPTPNFAPSWNVAPTDSLPIVRYNPKAGHRTLDLMRWGLVPYWARDHRDRLLDHYMPARFERLDPDRGVRIMRGRNQHGIRLGSAQKIIDGVKWFSRRKRLHAVSFRITDGGQLAARDFPRRDILRVDASH